MIKKETKKLNINESITISDKDGEYLCFFDDGVINNLSYIRKYFLENSEEYKKTNNEVE